MSEAVVCLHVRVRGRVQGVGYRDGAYQAAKSIGGLKGWVRNLDNGDVEILIQGPNSKVDAFVQWCHRGSPQARVDIVMADQVQVEPGLTSFAVRKY